MVRWAPNMASRMEDSSNAKAKLLAPTVLGTATLQYPCWFSATNNYTLFKGKISIACQEKYDNLCRLIHDKDYYVLPVVDTALYNPTNDPHEIEKGRLRKAHKSWDKEIDDMRIDRTSMFSYIKSMLSKESYDEVQGHKDWILIKASRDPLQLWLAVKTTHQILMASNVAGIGRVEKKLESRHLTENW
jgi:hypothetical protein